MTEISKAHGRDVTLVSTPNSLDGYVPHNQKLKTYPYQYIGFNPNGGNSKIYRYEDFENGTPSFKMIGEINPNPNIYMIPKNHLGVLEDLNNSGIIAGYPQIAWATDVFNTWLAQNSQIIELQKEKEDFSYQLNAMKTGGSMISNLLGMASGKADQMASGFTSFINSSMDLASLDVNHEFFIKDQMAQQEYHEKLANSGNIGGSNATLIGYDKFNKNIFSRYSIKRQFAERIDLYFDMYGYLTNKLKLPNLTNRPNWNYIKTIGANILGNIPQLDLTEIKDLFNNGITLWHNPATFLDYSQNNR